MSENRIVVDAPPEQVFDVLADPEHYEDWVVGAAETHDASARSWPRPGTLFRHRVGLGPLSLRDNTKVQESERPCRLVLEARFRPLGIAAIELLLEPRDEGTLVVMREVPKAGPAKLLHSVARPMVEAMLKGRNAKSLDRLKRLVEEKNGQAPPSS